MKTKLTGPCSFEDALKFCSESAIKYRLPSISELEIIALKSGIEFKSFWSSTEDNEGLIWIGSLVNGSFWKGDEDHETTNKNANHYALLILIE